MAGLTPFPRVRSVLWCVGSQFPAHTPSLPPLPPDSRRRDRQTVPDGEALIVGAPAVRLELQVRPLGRSMAGHSLTARAAQPQLATTIVHRGGGVLVGPLTIAAGASTRRARARPPLTLRPKATRWCWRRAPSTTTPWATLDLR